MAVLRHAAVTFEHQGQKANYHRPHPGREALRYRAKAARGLKACFNALVPSSERSGMVQSLIEGILASREKSLETVAKEFATHPDFAQARADSGLWAASSAGGLREPTPCWSESCARTTAKSA